MNRLSDISGAELTALANSIALYFSQNYSVSDIAKLVAFFTSIADILALISVDKIDDIDTENESTSNRSKNV